MHAILILVGGVSLLIGLCWGYATGHKDGLHEPRPRPLQIPPIDDVAIREQNRRLEENFVAYLERRRRDTRESPWYAIGWMYGKGLCNPHPSFYSHTEFQVGWMDARNDEQGL